MPTRYEVQPNSQHSAQVTPLQPPPGVLSSCEDDSCGQSCVLWSVPDRKVLLVQIHGPLKDPVQSGASMTEVEATPVLSSLLFGIASLTSLDRVVFGQLLPVEVLLDQYRWKKGLPLPFSFSFTSVSRSARGFASKSKFTKIRKKRKIAHTMKLYAF